MKNYLSGFKWNNKISRFKRMTRSFFQRDHISKTTASRYDFHLFIFHLSSMIFFLFFIFFFIFTNHRQTNFLIVRFDNWNLSSPQVSSVSRIVIKLSVRIDKTDKDIRCHYFINRSFDASSRAQMNKHRTVWLSSMGQTYS